MGPRDRVGGLEEGKNICCHCRDSKSLPSSP